MQTEKNSDQLMSDINVTPFVDVMLVLLIIFMVAAPMMVQGVDVDLPKVSATPFEREEEPLVVSIKKDQKIYINDLNVDVNFLAEKLQKIFENIDGRNVYLRADRDVPYGVVVNVMAKVKDAGIDSLGMITLPDEQKEN